MRLIDYKPNKLTLPATWLPRAEAVTNALLAEPDQDKRAEIIKANESLWSEVKGELAKIFNYKCWYTESRQIGTDVDVDHYRPKNRVAELIKNVPQHLGYWWLAFDLTNYRYSCIVANRRRRDIVSGSVGGKSDHFPIADEVNRAWDNNGDLDNEQPLLLDPCKASDVRLLTFKEDGEAMPREKEEQKPRLFKRAKISIEYYSLNHSDFVRERIKLREELRGLINDAKKYYNKLDTGDAIHEHAYEQAIQKIRNMIDIDSEFSSFCIAYLDNYRHEEALTGVFL